MVTTPSAHPAHTPRKPWQPDTKWWALNKRLKAGLQRLSFKRLLGPPRKPRQRALVIACSYGYKPPQDQVEEADRTATNARDGLDVLTPRGPPTPRGRDGGPLMHAHNDGYRLCVLLRGKYGFSDIDILIDDGQHIEPTSENIILAIGRLLTDARPGDNFVFAFVGHGGQKPNTDQPPTEIDGQDELIYPLDFENPILDDDLYKYLVDRLPDGCKLTAIFDSCHSGTALDQKYGREATEDRVLKFRMIPPSRHNTSVRQNNLVAGIRRCLFTDRLALTTRNNPMQRKIVISLSACRDDERAWEFRGGYSMTDLLVTALDKGPLNCETVLRALSHAFAKIYRSIGQTVANVQDVTTEVRYKRQNPQIGSNHEDIEDEEFIAHNRNA